jgi:hypothetical protein
MDCSPAGVGAVRGFRFWHSDAGTAGEGLTPILPLRTQSSLEVPPPAAGRLYKLCRNAIGVVPVSRRSLYALLPSWVLALGLNYVQAESLKPPTRPHGDFPDTCRPSVSRLEPHVGCRGASAPFRTSPHDAWIPFQGAQLFVAVGPFRRVADCDVIERLATGAAVEQRRAECSPSSMIAPAYTQRECRSGSRMRVCRRSPPL